MRQISTSAALWAVHIFSLALLPSVTSRLSELDLLADMAGQVLKYRLKHSLPSALELTTRCAKAHLSHSLRPSPIAHLTTPQLIRKFGYPVEKHKVKSPDGYILTLFRIPRGRHSTKTGWNFPRNVTGGKPAALLWHGLMLSSSDWLMNPEDKCLPYILANAGYDVWLGNARGTTYSNKHVRLTRAQEAYWRFSWHEMGTLDIPAVIDYILAVTKQPSLYYIGHSMGTTMFWVAMSTRPEYNAKIRLMTALAPVGYLGNMISPLALMAPFGGVMQNVLDTFNHGEFFPDYVTALSHMIGPLSCALSPMAMTVCGAFFFSIAGFDPCQFNTTQQISAIVGHTPDSVSARTFTHYLQLKGSSRFRAYDFGSKRNKRVYGSTAPPDYDLTRVTAKVAAFWGQNDYLAVPADVQRTVGQLPNLVANERIDFDLWSHLDFKYGMDVNPLLHKHVLRLMAENY